VIESLEQRTLMSVDLTSRGTLVVKGTTAGFTNGSGADGFAEFTSVERLQTNAARTGVTHETRFVRSARKPPAVVGRARTRERY
jgi:hypothetical protein